MKVYTKLVWDADFNVIEEEAFEYNGLIAECKGSDEAKKDLKDQRGLERDAYNLQKAKLARVEGGVGKYVDGNIGYDPEQLAIMKSQFLNQLGLNYNQAGKNVMTALARRGSISSTDPVGGDYTRGLSALEGGLASDRSSGLANIDLSNLQQALNNKFNAASLINGQAATLNSPISTFGSGGNNALGQYIQASNSGFGAAFSQGFGRALGNTFGGGNVSIQKQV